MFYNRYNTGKPALVIVGGAIGGAMFFAGARSLRGGDPVAISHIIICYSKLWSCNLISMCTIN